MTPPINLHDTPAQSARRTVADQRDTIRQRINNMSSTTGTCTTARRPSRGFDADTSRLPEHAELGARPGPTEVLDPPHGEDP
jgi:hypothetical protein